MTDEKQIEGAIEHISYKLEGAEAETFRAFKKQLNLKNNSEVGRKALLDQMRLQMQMKGAAQL